jgi:predicted dienelactone hydrolase
MKYKKLGSSDLEVGAAAAARASQPQAIVFVFGRLTFNCATRTKHRHVIKLSEWPKAQKQKQLQARAAKALLPLAVLHPPAAAL